MSDVVINAHVPDELLKKFMQHIRDFDTENPGCHFQIFSLSELSEAQIESMLNEINPPLPIRGKFRKQ